MQVFPDKTGALCANSHPGSYTGQDAFNNMLPVICNYTGGVFRQQLMPVITKEQDQGMEKNESLSQYSRKYVLRRLLPTECLLLQGFPKWWVDGANGSDSAIYRAAGNSLAVPCAVDILGRIARFVEEERHGN